MGNPLSAGAVDLAVATILDRRLRRSSLSLRALSRDSDVKLTRLGDVLRRGAPVTVGELDRIASALGLVGWEVLREAQGDGEAAELLIVDGDGGIMEQRDQRLPRG